MKVGVVGSSGFVGGHVAKAIERAGWRVASIHHSDPDPSGCDWVVNCAGSKRVRTPEDRAANSDLPATLYRAALNAGCKGFIHVSSVAAIASVSRPTTPVIDGDHCKPTNRYGFTKLQGDKRLLNSAGRAALCILRPPILISRDAPGLFSKLRMAAMLGIPLPLRGNGNLRSFMHVDNFAAAVIAAIRSGIEGTYITTDSEPVEPAELYRMMLAERGKGRRTFSLTPLGRAIAKKLLGRRKHSLFSNAHYDGRRFVAASGCRYPLTFGEAVAESMARPPWKDKPSTPPQYAHSRSDSLLRAAR